MKDGYIVRELEKEIQRLDKLYKVIVITGPRQSGKTTLCRNLFAGYKYFNLEDLSLREEIMTSPKAFLIQYANGLILDEVQNLPEIFHYIQVVADELNEVSFILTGSSNFSLMQNITQSLAGRAAVFSLLPLSLKELREHIKDLNTNTLLLNGGYPAVWAKNIPPQDVSRNYYNTYIERDVRQLINIKGMSGFQIFIKLCAGRIGTEFNASALSNDVGVSVPTINEWISVLEASYILFRLPPFFKNIGKRLVKSPKLYFFDTAIACFLLGIENESQLNTHPLRGLIFENIVVLEFLKSSYNNGKLPNLYFYRDKSQNEVDLIEEKGNKLNAYEIKSAKSFTKDFVSSLNYFRKVAGDLVSSTKVIYDGETEIHSTENGIVNYRNLNL